MAFVYACEFPDHLWFDVARDVWLEELPGGGLRLGMTDPAVTRAGRIVHVRVRAGRQAAPGQGVASVESSKWVGPVPTPLEARVLRGNPLLASDPGLLNRDPYGEGWLAEIEPVAAAPDLRALGLRYGTDALAPYTEKLRQEGLNCIRCADGAGQ